MGAPQQSETPTLEKPYLVLMRFMGVWHIETFDDVNKAHDRAIELRQTSKRAFICVVWLLEIKP
jgi:hypothetical protein